MDRVIATAHRPRNAYLDGGNDMGIMRIYLKCKVCGKKFFLGSFYDKTFVCDKYRYGEEHDPMEEELDDFFRYHGKHCGSGHIFETEYAEWG